jgi:hypothetical protein
MSGVGTKFKRNYVGLNPVPMVLSNDSQLAQILAQTMILKKNLKLLRFWPKFFGKKAFNTLTYAHRSTRKRGCKPSFNLNKANPG